MGVATVAAIVAIVAFAATLFRGGLAESAPVTVISPRAGLVMNPDAKVQIRGVQVGKVASIEQLPNGEAALHLARTVCRRAERRIVSLEPPADALIVRYVNRLSDLLFVLARVVNRRAGVPEIEW